MEEKAAALFRELEEICAQYKQEVPGRRRAWPESVKKRVLALRGLGINSHQVAKRLPIPYMTLVSWHGKSAGFLPVKVASSKPPTTVTVVSRRNEHRDRPKRRAPTTVTVVLTSGVRVEGLDARAAADFLKRLS